MAASSGTPRRVWSRSNLHLIIMPEDGTEKKRSKGEETMKNLKSTLARRKNEEREKNNLLRNYTITDDEGDTRTNYHHGISEISLIQISLRPPSHRVPLIAARSPEQRNAKKRGQVGTKRISFFPSKRMLRQIYTSQFTAHRGH